MPSTTKPSLRRDVHNNAAGPLHPGQYVREKLLAPRTMSVTAAAKLIGISRPGVSNFLNGKVSATPEMASRIERAFQTPAQMLLDMQAAYDAEKNRKKGTPENTKTYVPPFLTFKANDVEGWASRNIQARTRLSVFLRTLVHSTGIGLTKVDFPGNDDAERPGWDGIVEASEGTPWIPAGVSGWEFGTNANIKEKADRDFGKSVKALTKKELEETTFVFVTPRVWAGKDKWAEAMRLKGLWKDVRAYDASIIEQWLEQSLAGQTWFANETLSPAQDVRSLDKCWSDWASVATPPLIGDLFGSAIEAGKRTMLSRLSKAPDGPTIISADSVQEALAFLSQLVGEKGGEELAKYRDRVMVFDKPGVIPRLAQGAQTFIPVAFTREVERELAPFSKSMHCIVVYPRNASNAEPHIVLEPVDYKTFSEALGKMGKDRDEISRLTNASGRSLTVLRRQLSDLPAIRTPEWAADHTTAASLVPFLFVGAWDSKNETDKMALSLIANDRNYEELEKDCQRFAQINDAPLWSIGAFRGVISKIDLLYAISGAITPSDLRRYYSMARMVLGEDDPALDLPENERWVASVHGKARDFSNAFREGISETLVLLAVHGGNLFKTRLGFDTEVEAARVVRDLLPLPLTMRALESNDRDLPTYAEAAPDAFLFILENDLASPEPAVLGLLRPVETGFFGASPSRTGLLWALEGLSWNPENLPRAASILARLAQTKITDNWVNKPTHSLESIFRDWMPQTAASHEVRIGVLKQLAMHFPDVAWKICVAQFGGHHQVGDYSHKPRWRPDGFGFGEPFSIWGPILKFRREMVEMALAWESHSLEMLCDLVARLHDLDEEYRGRVWALVTKWAAQAGDGDKAALREKIRVTVLSRRAARRQAKKDGVLVMTAAAKAAYEALEPADLLDKHAWLFRDGWVEESADEIHGDDDLDYKGRDKRISKLRIDVLREVMAQLGVGGILELADRGKAAWQIGWLVATELLASDESSEFLSVAFQPILTGKTETFSRKSLISGALRAIVDVEKREAVIRRCLDKLTELDAVQFLLLAPFCQSTWKFVDGLSDEGQEKYWNETGADWIHDSDEENNEAIQRLLKARRPRAAFACCRYHPEKIPVTVLYNLLSEMAKGGNDQPGHYPLGCVDELPQAAV